MNIRAAILAPVLALCLLLTGCSFLDGSDVSVTPHQEQKQSVQTDVIAASSYGELISALEQLIDSAAQSATIHVEDYPSETLESSMIRAVRYTQESYPMGAYAVEEIHYELGTSGGVQAVAVTITYRHTWAEIQRISRLADMDAAAEAVAEVLEDCDASTVLLVESYAETDFAQLVEDYAAQYPQIVMETPQVTANIYGQGSSRVIELIFTYQNSRDDLRQMQAQVQNIFNSAVLYVSGEGADRQKLSQLYGFLMERFEYTIETSITPAYSLLRHGVGDSKAFATVYAAMCRAAGLECETVTGTYAGEPRTWNIVLDDGYYYHVDLLRSRESGGYQELTDSQMRNYVWDYSAYPECTGAPAEEETPSPSEPSEPLDGAQPQQEAAPSAPESAQDDDPNALVPTEIPDL